MNVKSHPMKRLLLLTTLCAPLAGHAAEFDAAAPASSPTPAATKLAPGRCPTMPTPRMLPLNVTGDFQYLAQYSLKADGRVENVRVQGRGPKELAKSIATAIESYRCLPSDTDQEIATEFRFKVQGY